METQLKPHQYVNIIQLLRIEHLDERKKKTILEHAVELVQWRVLNKAFAELDDQKKRLLNDYLERNDTDGLLMFLQAHSIDFDNLVETEIENLKRELVQLV